MVECKYQISTILFLTFTITCRVAPTLSSLNGFRFLAGFSGAASLVLNGGSVAELYTREGREGRGAKMAIFAIGSLVRPLISRQRPCKSGIADVL
jgi:MFS family permease